MGKSIEFELNSLHESSDILASVPIECQRQTTRGERSYRSSDQQSREARILIFDRLQTRVRVARIFSKNAR